MMNYLNGWTLLQEDLKLIKDDSLYPQIDAVYKEAVQIGGWSSAEEAASLPFSIAHPEFGLSFERHVHIVTRLCEQAYQELITLQPEYPLDHDILIAGALVHDIGKVFALERDCAGKLKKSRHEELVRHPISGAGLVLKHGMAEDIAHIVAYHSNEGIGRYRSPEAVILNKMDYLAYDIMKAYFGIKQDH